MNYSMPSLKLINKDLDLKIPNFKFDYSFNGLRVLELKNILFSYNNEKTFDFNGFSVSENEYIYLSGLSGSGKTTFINILSGLLRPDKGILRLMTRVY